ncbi:MAG TPA: lipid-binding SYLF domain-containing protein [Acetobacteraceae bacterium]|jgi:lipid-binding SYLF domain-containing protein
MRRFVLAATALAALLAPGLTPGSARAQGVAQTLVDRATLSLQEMMTQTVSQDPRIMLQRSRAVMICPRVFKAGFIIGGSGGDCVLLARAGNGTWSYPAFYGVGSGSVGFQIGIEDSSVVMMIMTGRGLNAVMDSQFKLGGDASVAVATIGGTVGGATTAAVGADILVYAETRGLFGGVSVEGSIMSLRSDWNAAYYGQPYAARQIVMQMVAANRGADPLREVLTRFGTPAAIQVGSPSPPPPPMGGPGSMQTGQGYAPAYPQTDQGYGGPPSQGYGGQPVQLQPNAPVRQQSLPPPSR